MSLRTTLALIVSLAAACAADEPPADVQPQASADAAGIVDVSPGTSPRGADASDALTPEDVGHPTDTADAADVSASGVDADASPSFDAADAADTAQPDGGEIAPDTGPPRWNPPEPGGCNGWLALCDRPYDQVSYATAHNAMSSDMDGWFFANQHLDVPHQLALGIRGLMLDVHPDKGDVALCHGTCLAGSQPLVEGLAEIRAFLDDNRREVVTLILESYVPPMDVAQRFEDADLAHYAHAHTPGTPWPTLGALVDAGERLVVLSDNAGGPPWHMDVWEHAFETHYHFESVAELSCDPNRGDPANPLFILNHFLTSPIASQELAEQVNHNPLLWDRAVACQADVKHLPTFLTLDFVDIGDLIPVVDALNKVP
ncbi:MAG: hypothetical protein AMXMBFR64_62710 [Myxococcales bacterium]